MVFVISSACNYCLGSCISIEMSCNDPPSIENGHFVVDAGVSKSITIGSMAVYSCDNGYAMENVSEGTLKCHLFEDIDNAQWKGILPTCRSKFHHYTYSIKL